MSYRVSIARIEPLEEEVRPWQKLCDCVPQIEDGQLDHEQYGYRPVVKKATVEQKVYEQILETLDVAGVIRAINSPLERYAP